MAETALFSPPITGCIFFAQRPRPRITYAGASAIARNPFANQPRGFYSADYFSGKNVNFTGRAFLEVKNAAVVFRIVFDDANGKPRADILRVLRARHRLAAVLAHGFKSRKRHRSEFCLIQDPRIGLRNWLVGTSRGPVIGVLCRAEQRTARAAIWIESGERAIHNDECDMLERGGQFNEHFLRDLEFRNFKNPPAGAQAVGRPNDKVKIRPHLGRELLSLERNAQLANTRLNKFAQDIWIVNVFLNFIAAIDEAEIHPLRPARF